MNELGEREGVDLLAVRARRLAELRAKFPTPRWVNHRGRRLYVTGGVVVQRCEVCNRGHLFPLSGLCYCTKTMSEVSPFSSHLNRIAAEVKG